MTLTLVAAVGRNGVIGVRGALPWRIPEDLRRFKALTLGGTLVMGRRTWDSIGRPLPGRRTIVVTRQQGWSAPGAEAAHSLEGALELAGTDRVFVVGGGEIYAQAIALADRLELTEVEAEPDGDARFPPLEAAAWICEHREQHDGFAFVGYVRSTGRAAVGAMRQAGSMSNDTTPDVPVPDEIPTKIPNRETGVGIGAGEPSTFEPEETPEETGGEPDVDPDVDVASASPSV